MRNHDFWWFWFSWNFLIIRRFAEKCWFFELLIFNEIFPRNQWFHHVIMRITWWREINHVENWWELADLVDSQQRVDFYMRILLKSHEIRRIIIFHKLSWVFIENEMWSDVKNQIFSVWEIQSTGYLYDKCVCISTLNERTSVNLNDSTLLFESIDSYNWTTYKLVGVLCTWLPS